MKTEILSAIDIYYKDLAPGTTFTSVIPLLQAVNMIRESGAGDDEGYPGFYYPDVLQAVPDITTELIKEKYLAKSPKTGNLVPVRRNRQAVGTVGTPPKPVSP